MTDIDEMLRDTGKRWRSVQPAPPRLLNPEDRRHRSQHRLMRQPVLTVLVPIAAAAAVAGVIVAITHRGGGTEVFTGAGPSVPTAKAPLLHSMPRTTGAFQIAAGSAGGSWSLWAKISPLSANSVSPAPTRNGFAPTFGPGLDMEVVTPQSSGGGGDDPTRMDSLVWRTYGPIPGFPAELVYGVTSSPATQVRITFDGPTAALTAPIYTNPAFGSLRFYAVAAPASAAGQGITATAISADGTPLVRTPANLNGPPVPPVIHAPTRGAMWPLAGSSTGNRGSAVAVATDFATNLLGIANPAVSAASSSSDSPTPVSITVPASGVTIKVLAVPTPAGWEIDGFLDPGRIYGITFNAGHTSVALHVPADTDSAEAVVLSDGNVDRFTIDKTELDAASALLPENNIQALIVIYKNTDGQTIGAGGATY